MEMGPWEREVFSPAVWIKPHVERDERHASEKLVGCAIRRTWALLPGWNSRRVNEMTEIIRQYGVRRWRGPERASLTSCANAVTKKKKSINTDLKDLNQRNPWRWSWKLTHHGQLMWKFNQWQTYDNACNGKSLLIALKIPPPLYKLLPLHRSTKSFRY